MISDTENGFEPIGCIITEGSDSRGIEIGTPHVTVERLCLILLLRCNSKFDGVVFYKSIALGSSFMKVILYLEPFTAESGTHAFSALHHVRVAANQNAHAAQCAQQLRGQGQVHTRRRRAHANMA
eukprot:2760475-Pleurochrysis_carterae.AAC.2